MRAEVISIGDEMTSGQRLDTNSQWLSQQLADLGRQSVAVGNGSAIGSAANEEGQIFIEPQGICVMAGIGPAAAGCRGAALSMAMSWRSRKKVSTGKIVY